MDSPGTASTGSTNAIASIFDKLDLTASEHDNRRVLAALEYLRG